MNMTDITVVFMRLRYFEERQANLYMRSQRAQQEKAMISVFVLAFKGTLQSGQEILRRMQTNRAYAQ